MIREQLRRVRDDDDLRDSDDEMMLLIMMIMMSLPMIAPGGHCRSD